MDQAMLKEIMQGLADEEKESEIDEAKLAKLTNLDDLEGDGDLENDEELLGELNELGWEEDEPKKSKPKGDDVPTLTAKIEEIKIKAVTLNRNGKKEEAMEAMKELKTLQQKLATLQQQHDQPSKPSTTPSKPQKKPSKDEDLTEDDLDNDPDLADLNDKPKPAKKNTPQPAKGGGGGGGGGGGADTLAIVKSRLVEYQRAAVTAGKNKETQRAGVLVGHYKFLKSALSDLESGKTIDTSKIPPPLAQLVIPTTSTPATTGKPLPTSAQPKPKITEINSQKSAPPTVGAKRKVGPTTSKPAGTTAAKPKTGTRSNVNLSPQPLLGSIEDIDLAASKAFDSKLEPKTKNNVRQNLEYEILIGKLDEQIARFIAQWKKLYAKGKDKMTKAEQLTALEYFKLKRSSEQSRDLLVRAQQKGLPLPKYRWEPFAIRSERSNPELSPQVIEMTIIGCRNLNAPAAASKADDLSPYITFSLESPAVTGQTGTISRNPNAQFNFVKEWPIGKRAPALVGRFKRAKMNFEIHHARLILRPILIGRVKVPLKDLCERCQIQDWFPVIRDDRKPGGELEVKFRLQTPLEGVDVREEVEDMLVLDEFQDSEVSAPTETESPAQDQPSPRTRAPSSTASSSSSSSSSTTNTSTPTPTPTTLTEPARPRAPSSNSTVDVPVQRPRGPSANTPEVPAQRPRGPSAPTTEEPERPPIVASPIPEKPVQTAKPAQPPAKEVKEEKKKLPAPGVKHETKSDEVGGDDDEKELDLSNIPDGLTVIDLKQPNSIYAVVSNDVFDYEIKNLTVQIANLKKQKKDASELEERKSAAELQLNIMVALVQSGKLSLDDYLERLRKAIAKDKMLAVELGKRGRKPEAVPVLNRYKIMVAELKAAEENREELDD